jgi:tetratricopeptide (TPR) repeat protein
MEQRGLMGASRVLAGCLLVAAGVCSVAQDAGPPSQQSSPPSSSQSSSDSSSKPKAHRSDHHIQVEDDSSPSQPAELTQAESAIDKQNYAAAEPLLRKLLEREPASYVGWFDLGFVENALGKLDESIAAYRKSVAAKPDVFESNLNLGLQLAKTGRPDAEQFLRAATQLKPTSHVGEGQYRAWLSLAETIGKSKPEEALAAYQHAAALQPKEAEPHLAAGLLLEREDHYAQAEQEYKLALALDSRSTDAVMGLAEIYMRGRRFPEAEEYLRKLLATNADSAAVHIQLARVLAAEGNTKAAIPEMEAGVKLAPADESALGELGNLYGSDGKNDLAEAVRRKLLAAHPNEAELHRELGQDLLRQKKFQEAQQEFTLAVKLKPDFGIAYGDLAFAAGENKDYPLVIRALDARVKLLPEIPITYFLRASAYDHLRDFKNAAANYHLFLKTANGQYPDQEWQAKHRLITIEPKK